MSLFSIKSSKEYQDSVSGNLFPLELYCKGNLNLEVSTKLN